MKAILKKAFNTGNYPNSISISLLLLRLIVGVFMLTHGYGKFVMLIGDGPIQFADPIGIGVTASLVLTVFAEFFCSIFLILGIATRFSAVPLLVVMLVAVFIVHRDDGFGKQELPLLYATTYFILAIAGAGKLSLDEWIYKRI